MKQQGGQNWTPITPPEGSIFHAETHAKGRWQRDLDLNQLLRAAGWLWLGAALTVRTLPPMSAQSLTTV
ncbi:hypothetical protein AGR1B_pa0090 [Agrobacterium fabacearum S56]|nr:hypothetical protein AGR1B_pa0090 [Agrobacterium fabacearum S56]